VIAKRFKIIALVFFVFSCCCVYTQTTTSNADERYLEDQFYFGFSYNLILDQPQDVNQSNLPYGIQLGFIKDIPVNKSRNIGLGLGIGYGTDSYFSNLQATMLDGGIINYAVLEDNSFRRSKIGTHQIEVPLELRWRTSTSSEYKFWRVYAGVKFAYLFSARSKFVSETERFSFSNPDIQDFQYGLTLNFGYNTFNIQAYYALQNLFQDNTVITDTGEMLQLAPLRIGIIFYIL